MLGTDDRFNMSLAGDRHVAAVVHPSHVTALLVDAGSPVDVLADVGRLHFDLAGYPIPRQLDALLTLTALDHLHDGSDYPFSPEFAVVAGRERLARAGEPAGSIIEALRGNTERLFPELGAGG
jgi:hypothetical protein